MLIIVPGRVPIEAIVPINDNNCRRDCGNSCSIRRRGTENKQTDIIRNDDNSDGHRVSGSVMYKQPHKKINGRFELKNNSNNTACLQ